MFLQTQLNLKTQVESKIMLSDNTLCICVPHVKDQIPKKKKEEEKVENGKGQGKWGL